MSSVSLKHVWFPLAIVENSILDPFTAAHLYTYEFQAIVKTFQSQDNGLSQYCDRIV